MVTVLIGTYLLRTYTQTIQTFNACSLDNIKERDTVIFSGETLKIKKIYRYDSLKEMNLYFE